MTIDQLKQRAGNFTPRDLAQIMTAAYAYAVRRGSEGEAAAYTNWYIQSHTLDVNAGWNNLPAHAETFAAWVGR